MEKTYTLLNTRPEKTFEVLSFLKDKENVSKYSLLEAVPVLDIYNIVGIIGKERKEAYANVLEIRERLNGEIKSSYTVPAFDSVGFDRLENDDMKCKSFFLINTQPKQQKEVVERLKDINEVTRADVIGGVYDIVAKVQAKTSDELDRLLRGIREVSDVRTSFPMRAINGGFTTDKGNVVDYCCL